MDSSAVFGGPGGGSGLPSYTSRLLLHRVQLEGDGEGRVRRTNLNIVGCVRSPALGSTPIKPVLATSPPWPASPYDFQFSNDAATLAVTKL